jgi:hypothetical protein
MKKLLALIVLLVAVTVAPARAQISDTYAGLDPWSWAPDPCTASQGLVVYEPEAPGRYPVLLYMSGTTSDWDGGATLEGRKVASEAAGLGFVAAAVRYDSWITNSPSGVDGHARCMFRVGPSSALSKLCARAKADCSLGVFSGGHSQGGAIAARSANVSPLVRAGLLLGVSGPNIPEARAAPNGTRMLPNDRIRIVTGVRDVGTDYSTMNAISGRNCTVPQCLAADGSGYYVVQDQETADGVADHCYHHAGGCNWYPTFDAHWAPPSERPWALLPGLRWLTRYAGGG